MTEIRSATSAGFEETYQQHWLPMVRLAALTTGSIAIAEEIVQDAFVSLYRSWDTVEQPRSYVRVAVIHGCTDWVRRQQLERRNLPSHPPESLPESPEPLDDLLSGLSPRQRLAVVLRFYEDLPEAAIADVLRCRTGTVKSLLHRAIHQLRKDLAL
jgi:RNA polymerase sigma factor (sigma-70 family)